MIPEAAVAMLACTALVLCIDRVRGVLPVALAMQVEESGSKLLSQRTRSPWWSCCCIEDQCGKAVVTNACRGVEKVIVVKCTGGDVTMGPKDVYYHDVCATNQPTVTRANSAEDPLFILYLWLNR